MQTQITPTLNPRTTAILLSLCACLASQSALAAETGKSSLLNRQGMQLKMDVGMLNPALMVAGEEDCEGDLVVQPAIAAPVLLASLETNLTTTSSSRAAQVANAARSDSAAIGNAAVAALAQPAAKTNADAKMSAEAKPAAVVAQTATPPQAAKPGQTWEIVPSDRTLNAALARWAATAGWQLVWELPVDYSVDARTSVAGTFEDAVGVVAKSMESAEIPLKAIFYSGNKVLRIVAKGVE